jgi:N-acetylneuraminic acid mutarotase
MSAPRYKHTASVLNDGVTVVLTGGFDAAVQGTTEVFTYNATTPTSSTWAAGPALAKSRHDHAASLLTGNRKILLTGGYGQGLDTVEICDFSLVTPACATTTAMSTSRASHTSTILGNGNVLVIGGNDGSQILKTIEIFDPATSIWTSHAKVLQTARAGHSSTLMSNGKVLISGANNQVGGATTATAELWIP